jgi:hypothetical protein
MGADDASSADMHRRPADPLALDDDTVERLLTGDLSPAQAPPAYARVAELLAAAAAAPSPGELAGQAAVLAELRAVTRARPPTTTIRRARTPRRRRRAGLAVVLVVGALATGGVAGAATGHLPGPVREAARSILGTAGRGDPASSTRPGSPPAPATRAAGPGDAGSEGSRPGGATGPGPGPSVPGPVVSPNLQGLCQAYVSGNGAQQGERLDATAFETLARAAGGEDEIAAYCQELLPGDQDPKKPKDPREAEPSGEGQDQGDPPAGTGSGDQGQGGPPATSSPPSPAPNR